MTALLGTRAGRWAFGTVALLALAVLALGLGRFVPTNPMVALVGAICVLALGLTAGEPAAVPVLSMPLFLVVSRVGAGGVDLTVSDVALFGSTLICLVFAPRPFSPTLRALLWLDALYQFATLFTVIANPFRANLVEWFHAWMLISGALIVGWTVGRRGLARTAITLFLVSSTGLAISTIVQGVWQYAQGDFSAVYLQWPISMHKNAVGCVLGFAAATAYARPDWLKLARGWTLSAFWVMLLGLVFTQSRQAIVGLGAALIVIVLRQGNLNRRSRLILVAVAPLLVLVTSMAQDQIESGNRFNSVYQRADWYQVAITAWRENPLLGHGLRYWYAGIPGLNFQPPNAELEVLASAGLVGLTGFLILSLGTLIVLWKSPGTVSTLAVVLVLSRVVQGQFDLFWVATQTSLPFLIVGVCQGVQVPRSMTPDRIPRAPTARLVEVSS